jgi:hypothetical protein
MRLQARLAPARGTALTAILLWLAVSLAFDALFLLARLNGSTVPTRRDHLIRDEQYLIHHVA